MTIRSRAAILAPALVVSAVWGFAFWWPTSNQIDENRRIGEDLAQQQLALMLDVADLESAQELASSYESDLDSFAVAVPADASIGSFVRGVGLAADTSGVRIDLFAPTNVVNADTATSQSPVPPSFAAVTLTLTAAGSFFEIMNFLDALDGQPRLIVMDSVSLTAADDASQEVVLDLEFRVFTTESLVEVDDALLLDFADEEPS